MELEEAKRIMVDALNAEVEALEAHRKERMGLPSWHRVEQARAHADAMKRQFVQVAAGTYQPKEEIPE